MGDFTNLSITLELDLTKPLLPGLPCTALSNLPGGVSLDDLLDLPNLCAGVSDALTLCANNPTPRNCAGIPRRILNQLCDSLEPAGPLQPGRPARWGRRQRQQRRQQRWSRWTGQGGLGGILDGLGLGGLVPRAAFNPGSSTRWCRRYQGSDHGAADVRLRPGTGLHARLPDGGAAVITRRTKIQLVIFVIITLVGVSYVGARYARLDRIVVDDAYTVIAHFPDSGGAFAGGEVTYRGVRIGRVDKLKLTDEGVDIYLDIDNNHDDIPADAIAQVGNRSAVGEQYVELQPKTDDGAVLRGRLGDRRGRHPPADPDRPAAHRHLQHRVLGRPGGPAHDRVRGRARRSPGRARTCRPSSTPATPSSRPPTTTSMSPPR